MKTCYQCGVEIRSNTFHYCERCQLPCFRIKEAAHQVVKSAVVDGRLQSLSQNLVECVDCGDRASQYEHRNYERPLDVEPVCRKCNKARGKAARFTDRFFSAVMTRWSGNRRQYLASSDVVDMWKEDPTTYGIQESIRRWDEAPKADVVLIADFRRKWWMRRYARPYTDPEAA